MIAADWSKFISRIQLGILGRMLLHYAADLRYPADRGAMPRGTQRKTGLNVAISVDLCEQGHPGLCNPDCLNIKI